MRAQLHVGMLACDVKVIISTRRICNKRRHMGKHRNGIVTAEALSDAGGLTAHIKRTREKAICSAAPGMNGTAAVARNARGGRAACVMRMLVARRLADEYVRKLSAARRGGAGR